MSETEKYPLYVEKFTPEMQPALSQLDCGDEPWARAATEWIKSSEVLDAMDRLQTSVWTYHDSNDAIIGFGSLEATSWKRWPPPDGRKSRLLYLRQLGIDAKFRGFPPERDYRYSNRILEHLIFQAKTMAIEIRDSKPPSKHAELLTLMVHRDNHPAQKLYQRYGFELLDGFERNDHLTMSHRLDLTSDI